MPSTLASKFNDFLIGATIPFRAILFIINQKGLLGLSLAPILSAIMIFAVLIYLLITGAWGLAHSTYLAAVSNYSGFIFALTAILVLSALAFFAVSILTFLMTLLSSPFNDILAEKTEHRLGVKNVAPWGAGRFIRVFWIDFRKAMVSIFGAIIFSVGMLIPVANLFFFIGLSLLNTFTFITYPQSRREQGLMQSLTWIRENFFLSLGFGVSTLLMFSIPLIGFFALPVAVVGGTILYCDSVKGVTPC